MRILRIITRLNIGGPSQQAILLSHALERRGWESLLVIGQPAPEEGEMLDWLERYPARWQRVPTLQRAIHPIREIRAWWALVRIMRAFKPDLVHTHTAKAGTLGRLAALWYRWWSRRPLVLVHTFHGHVLSDYFRPWHTRVFVAIERWLARRTDCVIAVNEAVRRDLLTRGIGDPRRIRLVPLGLELDGLLALPPPAPGEAVQLGLVGRLVPVKNHALFLNSVARLLREQPPPFRCHVIGDGELRPWLERLSHTMHLTSCVAFLGWDGDRERLYRNLDIVCLTSRNEGTPVALIEGLAAGRAVIATDVGGVRELLGREESVHGNGRGRFTVLERGVVVDSNDAEGFAQGVAWLLAQPSRRRELGEAGRAFVRERFAFARLEQAIGDLYGRLLDRTQRGEAR